MKTFQFFILTFLSFQFAFAQDDSRMDFGLRGGVNFASLGDLPQDYEKDGLKLGYSATLFARFKTGETGFYFQPEVSYSVTGGKSTFTNLIFETFETNTTLHSVDVPFLVGLRLGGEKLGIHINAGPALSYLLKADTKLKVSSVSGSTESKFDVIDEVNRLQAGFQIGAGLDLGPALLNVRYQTNLTNLYQNGARLPYSGGDAKLSFVQFSLGIKLF